MLEREIGSEFEPVSDAFIGRPTSPPWVHDSEPAYLSAGRQALTAVARKLAADGWTSLYMPLHHCRTMAVPFERCGMRIEYVDVDESMIMSAGALESTIDRLGVAPVLHSETFGARTPPALEKILNSIEQSGTPVIADETHSILQSRPSSFTYRIASLRKLLPLPDGAYVFGLDYMQPDREQGGLSEVVGLRLTAAEQKAAYLRGDRNDKAFLDIYARAENILDEFSDILPMSRQSEVLLASLDYESLSRRRESNATYLAAGLDDISSIRIVNREAVTTAPPYLVVSSDRVLELRTHLTAQGVYCPIHWPPPKESELRRRWKSPVLSMPIDHRYNHRDMQRIIDLIVEFERGRRVSR